MDFKAFADVLKVNIDVDASDDEFLVKIFNEYMREPSDSELQELKDKAKAKSQQTKRKVEEESWNPFEDISKDRLEKIYRSQVFFPVSKSTSGFARRPRDYVVK